MGNLVFQATLGGTTSLRGPNTAATNVLIVPDASGNLAWSTTALTATRVPYIGTGGLLQDSSTFTFDGANLTLTAGAIKLATAYQIQWYSGATQLGSILTDSGSNLTFQTGSSNTERMRINSSGNVGIGMTPVANYGTLQVGSVVTSAAGVSGLQAYIAGTNSAVGQNGNISVITTNAQAADIGGSIGLGGKFVASTGLSAPFAMIAGRKENSTDNNGAGYLQFSTIPNGGSTTERMRIDSSGNLLVGSTSVIASAKQTIHFFTGSNGLAISTTDNIASTDFAVFRANSATCGTISRVGTTSAVAYITTSDYRLKENVMPMTGALAAVAKLKPVTYDWKTGGSSQGFIAHELQTVVPDCVTGEKDAVNEDGSIKAQGIDTSFLVATLTAAIQELNAKVTGLEEQILNLGVK